MIIKQDMVNDMLNNFQNQVMKQRFVHRLSIIQIAMNLKTSQYYVDKAIKNATTILYKEYKNKN